MSRATPTLSRDAARLLFLQGQALLDPPERPCGPAAVRRLVRRLGFVQLDSIHVLERAHHLTLLARNRGYRREHLDTLYRKRQVFEHWTHDASLLPIEWHRHWHHPRRMHTARLDRYRWLARRVGDNAEQVLAGILDRVRAEGPLRSSDFADERANVSGGWWNYKPAKAALEYLYWRGDLCVVARPNFHKVYDLADRHVPDEHRGDAVDREAFVRWTVRESIDRLQVATPGEIAGFLATTKPSEVRPMLAELLKGGELELVALETGGTAYAVADWRGRLRRARSALARLDEEPRLLSPFDPIARDRRRLLRLFDFDYRFEAFTPEPLRKYGYYVLPVLLRDRMVGRVDLKHDRRAGTLRVLGEWPEPGQRAPLPIDAALQRLAAFIGAERVDRQASR